MIFSNIFNRNSWFPTFWHHIFGVAPILPRPGHWSAWRLQKSPPCLYLWHRTGFSCQTAITMKHSHCLKRLWSADPPFTLLQNMLLSMYIKPLSIHYFVEKGSIFILPPCTSPHFPKQKRLHQGTSSEDISPRNIVANSQPIRQFLTF